MPNKASKFETERTRKWRATKLHPTDERTIGQIEESGCSVISVGRDCKDDLSWTYTIGVYDTCGKPDLITVGLNFNVAQSCLNEAVRRMREGFDLTKGRQSDLIGNVDCELRVVDLKWVGHLMNWANWYYGGTDYPVLQVIYPDLKNKFQWDAGFDDRFLQPLMQHNAPVTATDRQFWGSVEDDKVRFPDWKFSDKPHTKTFISKAVAEGQEWITYVTHDLSDGAWQFVGDTGIENGGPVLACLHHMVEKDPTLTELADMPRGWYAERETPEAPWERFELEEQEAES
jgi:hypothetical protein